MPSSPCNIDHHDLMMILVCLKNAVHDFRFSSRKAVDFRSANTMAHAAARDKPFFIRRRGAAIAGWRTKRRAFVARAAQHPSPPHVPTIYISSTRFLTKTDPTTKRKGLPRSAARHEMRMNITIDTWCIRGVIVSSIVPRRPSPLYSQHMAVTRACRSDK